MKVLVFILMLAAAAGAQAQGMSMPTKSAASANAPSAMPLVDGELLKLDSDKGLVVLKHGAVPNLDMPAMTMGYDVADKKMLKDFKVGDKVKFQARMIGGKATVTELKR